MTNYVGLHHIKEDIKAQNLELFDDEIYQKLINTYGEFPFIFTDVNKVKNNFEMI
jgi:hypothetical protein